MTEGREKPIENRPPSEAEAQGPVDASRSATRRRLLRASVFAAPLLVTLHSRPVQAAAALGSLGIDYGLYTQNAQNQWVPAVKQPNGDLKPDPNGPDRRPNTGDEPAPTPP